MDTKRRHLTLLVDEKLIEGLKSYRENLSKIAEEAFRARLEEIKAKSKKSIIKDSKGSINLPDPDKSLFSPSDNQSNAGVAKPGKAPDLRSGYLRVSRVRIPSPAPH